MGAGQGVAAQLRVAPAAALGERRRVRRPLHVPQLAHVEAAAGRSVDPAQERVAGRLHEPLPGDHPVTVLGERRLAGERLQHGGLRLLDLQDHQVVLVAAAQQQHERQQADAAHPDDLVAHVDDLVPLEQLLAVVLQAWRGTPGTAR